MTSNTKNMPPQAPGPRPHPHMPNRAYILTNMVGRVTAAYIWVISADNDNKNYYFTHFLSSANKFPTVLLRPRWPHPLQTRNLTGCAPYLGKSNADAKKQSRSKKKSSEDARARRYVQRHHGYNHSSNTSFPSPHQLDYVATLIKPIASETDLRHFARDTVEIAVQKLVDAAYNDEQLRTTLGIQVSLTR